MKIPYNLVDISNVYIIKVPTSPQRESVPFSKLTDIAVGRLYMSVVGQPIGS